MKGDGEMKSWQGYLQRGIEYLSKHNPRKALNSFRKALEECPAEQGADLSKIFYYLGVTLKKLGLDDSALRSWNVGRKIEPHGHSGKMYDRYANSYGMKKQPTEDLDDWKAFYSIHLERYLQTKKSGKLITGAEKDMIQDLILDYWNDLSATGILKSKDPCEKIGIFRSINIVFPFLVVPEELEDKVIPVHFAEKKRLSPGDSCFCGSMRPYYLCCGRTPGEEELLFGCN
jgi:tetratricopeptide (TPR) repeat protein